MSLLAAPPQLILLAAGAALLALGLGYAIASWWLRPDREAHH